MNQQDPHHPTRRDFLTTASKAVLASAALGGLGVGCATVTMRDAGPIVYPPLPGKKVQPPRDACLVGWYSTMDPSWSLVEANLQLPELPGVVVAQDLSFTHALPVRMLEEPARKGVIPFVMSSPYGMRNATEPSGVLSGKDDEMIRDFARKARAFGEQWGGFFLTPMWEMNYERRQIWAWSGDPRTFKAVWKHIWNIFRGEGANEFVTWVAEYLIDGPLHGYYPGDEFVDWIGLSGYNSRVSRQYVGERSFSDLFGRAYSYFRSDTPNKPIMIAEMGSSATPGQQWNTQAEWYKGAMQSIRDTAGIKAAIIWSITNVEQKDNKTLGKDSLKVVESYLADPYFITAPRLKNLRSQ